MPFVHAIQLSSYTPALVSASTVEEGTVEPDGTVSLGFVRPFADFATPKPIDRHTNMIRVNITGAGGPHYYILTQYWDM
jgi:hypothetical protein